MAKRAGFPMLIYMDGFGVHGDVGSARMSTPRGVQVVTGVDKEAFERILLRTDVQCELRGFFNDATDRAHDVLSPLPTTDRNVLIALGDEAGVPALAFTCKQQAYDFEVGDDGSLASTIPVSGASGYAPEWCRMITAGLATLASEGDLPGVDDLGVEGPTAYGAAAHVHAGVAATGGTVTLAVGDSADDMTYAGLITFDGVFGDAELSERKTVTGDVDRYLRVSSTGTFTDLPVAMAVRRGRAADDIAY